MSYVEQLSKLTGVPPNRLRVVLWQELPKRLIGDCDKHTGYGLRVVAQHYVETIERLERDK